MKPPGNPGGGNALAVVAGEREEVDAGPRLVGGGGDEDDGVAVLDGDGEPAACLARAPVSMEKVY